MTSGWVICPLSYPLFYVPVVIGICLDLALMWAIPGLFWRAATIHFFHSHNGSIIYGFLSWHPQRITHWRVVSLPSAHAIAVLYTWSCKEYIIYLFTNYGWSMQTIKGWVAQGICNHLQCIRWCTFIWSLFDSSVKAVEGRYYCMHDKCGLRASKVLGIAFQYS